MNYTDCIMKLFDTTPDVPGHPRVQVFRTTGEWSTVPLEWNTAMRMADIADASVRMVGADDKVLCEYHANGTAA